MKELLTTKQNKMEKLKEQLDFLETKNKRELLELAEMMVNNKDFVFELVNGEEYRIINDKFIYHIYCQEQEDVLNEIYPEIFDKKPWWVEIDIDKTIDNILQSDGYGSLFATYDGDEHEVILDGDLFHFFRTN